MVAVAACKAAAASSALCGPSGLPAARNGARQSLLPSRPACRAYAAVPAACALRPASFRCSPTCARPPTLARPSSSGVAKKSSQEQRTPVQASRQGSVSRRHVTSSSPPSDVSPALNASRAALSPGSTSAATGAGTSGAASSSGSSSAAAAPARAPRACCPAARLAGRRLLPLLPSRPMAVTTWPPLESTSGHHRCCPQSRPAAAARAGASAATCFGASLQVGSKYIRFRHA